MASPVLPISSFLPLTSPPRLPSKKPSWIGRPPAVRLTTMKQQVRLSYRSRGLRPPVYAVTSLSDPQWEPVEMHSKDIGDSELEFWRTFDADVGDHQYKFRLGPGDWWVLDESKPSVDDGYGNRNNVITVKAPTQAAMFLPAHPPLEHTSHANHQQIPHQTHETPLGINLQTATKHAASPIRLSPSDPMTPPMTPEIHDDGRFQPLPPIEIRRPSSASSHYSSKSVEDRPSSAASHHSGTSVISVEHRPSSAASHYSDKSVEEAHDQPLAAAAQQTHASVFETLRTLFLSLGSWLMNLFGGGARFGGAVAVFVGLAAIAYKVRNTVMQVYTSGAT